MKTIIDGKITDPKEYNKLMPIIPPSVNEKDDQLWTDVRELSEKEVGDVNYLQRFQNKEPNAESNPIKAAQSIALSVICDSFIRIMDLRLPERNLRLLISELLENLSFAELQLINKKLVDTYKMYKGIEVGTPVIGTQSLRTGPELANLIKESAQYKEIIRDAEQSEKEETKDESKTN